MVLLLILMVLNGLMVLTFPIKGNPLLTNGPKSLPTNSPDFLFYATEFLIILY